MNELAIQNTALTVENMKDQVNAIQQVMQGVMQENQHYGVIPGCGDKPTLLKPGAEKLCLLFQLRTIIGIADIEIIDIDPSSECPIGGHREYRVRCHMTSKNGEEIATGIGICTTMEGKYRFRTGPKESTGDPVPREYWDTRKANPQKALELIGGKGHSTGKDETGQWVIMLQGERIEHDNPADYYNTCLKIAKKRAHVDGTLSATGASDMFTQDIEDMPEVISGAKGHPASGAQKPSEEGSEQKPAAEAPRSASETNGDMISIPQGKRFYAIAKGAGMSDEQMNKWLLFNHEIGSSKEIPKAKYDEICTAVGNWKPAPNA